MKKIKIAFISVSSERIGPNYVILNIAKSIDRNVYEPIFIPLASRGWGRLNKKTEDFTNEFKKAKIEVVPLNILPGLDLLVAVPKLLRLFKKMQPDIVHTHLLRADVYGRVAAGRMHIPVISTIHNEDPWLVGSKFTDKITRRVELWTKQFVDAFVAVAPNVQEYFIRNGIGIDEKKMVVIKNAVDTAKFFPRPEVREQKRKELGVTNEMVIVGTSARLIEQKDPFTMLSAIEKAFTKNVLAKFFWAGEGHLRKRMEEKIANSPLKNRFVLLGDRSDIPELLQAFDIFVLSSVHEGLPIALLEAMATGKAACATRVSGNRVVIEDHVNGLLANPQDADDLSAKVTELLVDAELRTRLGVKAVKDIEERYSLKNFAQMHEQLYQRILAQKASGTEEISTTHNA